FGEISFDNENRGLNILWNHRWEYDKNPIEFMKIVQHLSESEKDIRLHLLGRRFASLPQGYAKFIKDIEHLVLNESFQEEGDYIRFVKDSSCSIVTAIQDYFGISVIEAMYCGVVPFVPDRVVYPEHFSNFKNLLYHSEKDLLSKLSTFFDDPNSFDRRAIHNYARQFDWSNLISEYDQNLLKLCH
ncbi:MAG: glycosyltransferase, partial [Flavobacteriales bacterium]|nr:glycosyltransferase [Flavobacteriales bacterium]